MLKIISFILIVSINIFALSLSSNDNYKVHQSKDYNIIFTPDYKNEALFIKKNLDDFLKFNAQSFGYTFDQPIKIVLISDNLQVPNAFSTPVPYNMGVYYNGGSSMNDYFATKSWLITLFTHEMVHNYQMNAKKSKISQTLHKFLGNNFMPIWAGTTFFTLPNIFLPTALVEGSAVLNETLYDNGGRLYSGSLNALKNSLIFHDKINPASFINDHLNFPYTQEKYIVGGFFMQYLAYLHGIDKVNNYFYENSIHSMNPFLLNSTFKKHFAINFEQSIKDFVTHSKNKYTNYKEIDTSNTIASSKDEIYLSKIDNEIFFITTDYISNKNLHSYNIDTNLNTKKTTTLKNGKVFKIDNKLFVSSSDFISSTKYKHGLFDDGNYIMDKTIGKSINDIYKEKFAYIDIKTSFLNSKLYIDDNYYSDVSSSALFDNNGNIYYFKQIDNNRVLYKNKQELYRFDGYFSKIIDIVDNEIYFIANSKNGSSLYKYSSNKIFRLNKNDNIINGKIIDKNNALVVSITHNGYNIKKVNIRDQYISNIEKSQNIKIPNKFKFDTDIKNTTIKSNDYNALFQLEFSYIYPSFSYNSEDGSSYLLDALFMDPIMFNMLYLYTYKDIDERAVGLNYVNERYIPFAFNIYDLKRDELYEKERGYGGSFEIYGPLLKKGRHLIELNLKKYLDDKNIDKSPTILSFSHNYSELFPLASLSNLSSNLELLVKEDREDMIYGASYSLNKQLLTEFYINIGAIGLYSDIENFSQMNQRGIEVTDDIFDKQKDNSNIFIEGIDDGFFAKEVEKVSIGLSKTFYLNHYFAKFPISLMRESIFYKYNYFNIKTTKEIIIKEHILGIKIDLLLVHKLYSPIIFKIIKNDYSKDDYKFIISTQMGF